MDAGSSYLSQIQRGTVANDRLLSQSRVLRTGQRGIFFQQLAGCLSRLLEEIGIVRQSRHSEVWNTVLSSAEELAGPALLQIQIG